MQRDSNVRHGVMGEFALPHIGIDSNRMNPCACCAWSMDMAYKLRQQVDNVGHIFIFARKQWMHSRSALSKDSHHELRD